MIVFKDYASDVIDKSFNDFFTLQLPTSLAPLAHVKLGNNALLNFVLPSAMQTITMHDMQELKKSYADLGYFGWIVNNKNRMLVPRLVELGFKKHANFTGMLASLDENIQLPNLVDLTIHEVTNEKLLDDMVNVFCETWSFDDKAYFKNKFLSLLSNPNVKNFVAYHQQKPVCCGMIHIQETTAGFYNFSVLPEYRNKGFGSAFQKYRMKFAFELGCDKAVLQASDQALNLDRQLGFEIFDNYAFYLWGQA